MIIFEFAKIYLLEIYLFMLFMRSKIEFKIILSSTNLNSLEMTCISALLRLNIRDAITSLYGNSFPNLSIIMGFSLAKL